MSQSFCCPSSQSNCSHRKLNYHDQKIRQTLASDTQKQWTAASTLLGLISSVYRDLSPTGDRTSDHRIQSRNSPAEPSIHNTHKRCQINSSWQLRGQLNWMCLASYIRTLYRGHGHLQGHIIPRGLEIRICVIIITSRARK